MADQGPRQVIKIDGTTYDLPAGEAVIDIQKGTITVKSSRKVDWNIVIAEINVVKHWARRDIYIPMRRLKQPAIFYEAPHADHFRFEQLTEAVNEHNPMDRGREIEWFDWITDDGKVNMKVTNQETYKVALKRFENLADGSAHMLKLRCCKTYDLPVGEATIDVKKGTITVKPSTPESFNWDKVTIQLSAPTLEKPFMGEFEHICIPMVALKTGDRLIPCHFAEYEIDELYDYINDERATLGLGKLDLSKYRFEIFRSGGSRSCFTFWSANGYTAALMKWMQCFAENDGYIMRLQLKAL